MPVGLLADPSPSHYTCHHPFGRRRAYTVEDAWVEVCWSCLACRSRPGEFWVPRTGLTWPDGSLTTLEGALIAQDYLAVWSRPPPDPTGHT